MMRIFDKKDTLFLDRDGVINERLVGDYVKSVHEMKFIEGALEAIAQFSKRFKRIFVITNQSGIAKKLMSLDDLYEVHRFMLDKINAAGGHIDKIYYCPHGNEDDCNCRKPETGMITQALSDFPEINIMESVLIGDSESDIIMGKRAGVSTVLISSKNENIFNADFCCSSLLDFSRLLL